MKIPFKIHIYESILAINQLTLPNKLTVLAFTVFWFCIIILQYHFLVLSFTDVWLFQSIIAVSATLLTKTLIPLTFADIGIREGILVFFYSQFGVANSAAFNASILIFLINFMIPGITGFYYVAKLKTMCNTFPDKTSTIMEKN